MIKIIPNKKDIGAEIECEITQFKLRVFDRWGAALFYTEDATERWDGKVNNNLAPIGSYGWICEYKGLYDGEKINRKQQGNVMLIQ